MTAPIFDPSDPYAGLSSFQRSHVQSLLMRPEFKSFVLVDGDLAKTFQRSTPGPMNVLWYDKQGNVWIDRIGQAKLLYRVSSKEGANQ